MSDTTIPANTRVRYTDGHTDEIMVTMFQRTAAETYGKAHGWGSLMEPPSSSTPTAPICAAARPHLPICRSTGGWQPS